MTVLDEPSSGVPTLIGNSLGVITVKEAVVMIPSRSLIHCVGQQILLVGVNPQLFKCGSHINHPTCFD